MNFSRLDTRRIRLTDARSSFLFFSKRIFPFIRFFRYFSICVLFCSFAIIWTKIAWFSHKSVTVWVARFRLLIDACKFVSLFFSLSQHFRFDRISSRNSFVVEISQANWKQYIWKRLSSVLKYDLPFRFISFHLHG